MKKNSLKILGVFFGFIFTQILPAQTRVAWMELRNKSGGVMQLEPDFYYAHIAIQIGNQWLHAHPQRGVESVSKEILENLGEIKEVLVSNEEDSSYLKEVPYYFGRAFDSEFSWTDEKIYCAELIAKLLRVQPTPMHFDLKYWHPWFQKYEGKPGSSPSKLYYELLNRGYEKLQ